MICLAVPAVRTSGMTAGEVESGQKAYSRLAAVNSNNRSTVFSGAQTPPGSWAQTRITPSSVTTQVAQPWRDSDANHVIAPT